MKLDKTMKARLAAPVELFLAYKFKDFLFFYLRFAKLLTIVLQPRETSSKHLKSDIILKMK